MSLKDAIGLDISPGEDRAGFVVPRWRAPGGRRRVDVVDVPTVCLAPWRPAPGVVVEILSGEVGVAGSDVVVDLGSGDGRVLIELALRTGCRGVGIEASANLVRAAAGLAAEAGVDRRVTFLHELIGARGLRGATLVYCWLLPGSASLVRRLVAGLVRGGVGTGAGSGVGGAWPDQFRGLVVVGDPGEWPRLGEARLIGEVPDRGRIRSDAGLPVRWLEASDAGDDRAGR